MKYYTAMKKKKVPIQATGCMDLTNDAERKGDRMSICYVVPFKSNSRVGEINFGD